MGVWQEALYELGLLLLIEGALYALVPDRLRNMLMQGMQMSDAQLRNAGLIAAAIGLAIIWFARGAALS